MACKNGIMIILTNLQAKMTCKHKVLGIHTQNVMYPRYEDTEFGIGDKKMKNEVEGNDKML